MKFLKRLFCRHQYFEYGRKILYGGTVDKCNYGQPLMYYMIDKQLKCVKCGKLHNRLYKEEFMGMK